MADTLSAVVYFFGPFCLTGNELLRDDTPVDIDPMPLQLLRYLILNRDRKISRKELEGHLWPDTHVTADALDAHVHRLRRALHDSATQPKYVKTAPKRGYRFIANVAEVPSVFEWRPLPADSSESPREAITTFKSPDVYVNPAGWFQLEPDGTWTEYPEYAPGKHYTFEEFGCDREYLYLKDDKRRRDSGRPMLLRLPVAGGIAQWSYPNPLDWVDYNIVWPKR